MQRGGVHPLPQQLHSNAAGSAPAPAAQLFSFHPKPCPPPRAQGT